MMKSILIVDDEPVMRYLVKRILEEGEYEITEAEGGNDCLAKLKEKRPDLILLDVMMPDLSGFEVLEEIKKMENPVPVVMLTVVESPDEMKPEDYKYVIDYIRKPFEEEDLIKRVEQAFKIIES